ncbi:purple acid phosphatase family protein [Chitinophaga cymbidii]|uniref:Calcineurin-like phosphoesterase domain-containing protein n=1 Tax=Chitinophaga cymbidii TaxID=1096750 RepID=A0A512RF51_9BACT|nr:metallophosphoesterase family protein [Chitinophaga cymbidii]GEP94336.1 hypothetical protein CCY01nite_05960 [Chitinophaga cymbidii]
MQDDKPVLGRRGFLGTFAKAGILSAAGLAPAVKSLAAASVAPEAHAFLCPPYLQNPAPTAMTLMWLSNKPSYSWIEYGETAELGLKAHHSQAGIVDSYNRIYRIRLEHLQPGTTYYYKVFSKEIAEFRPYKLTYGGTISSELFSFTTPEEDPEQVSWLVMNDIHDRPASIPHLVSLSKEPYDFVFFNGDIFDYQEDEKQIIDHLLTPAAQAFASQKPFIFTRGNHETRGKFRRELPDYFDHPWFFAKTWGPVHFTVLDTGEDKEDTHPVYAGIVDFDEYRRQQAEWFKQVAQTKAFKKAKFRVVMMHIPVYHSGDWHGPMECQKLFGPLFQQHKIDLFLAGHTHRYVVHQPVEGKHAYPVVIGGGPKEGARTIMHVKADQKNLKLVMLKDDGSEVGRVELKSRR